MTLALEAKDIAAKLDKKLSASVLEAQQNSILVKSSSLPELFDYLKNTPGLDFDYLADITGVDYWDYFELVYQLVSIKNNHKITVKTRLAGRENLNVPSIVSLYQGASYQEREISELLGIKFEGHPNPNHLLLWEGFQGYPLRKDYL